MASSQVSGSIDAVGTPDAPIVFKGNGVGTGLILKDGAKGVFRNVRFVGLKKAVDADDTNVSFTDCEFINCGVAISTHSGSKMKIRGTTFSGNKVAMSYSGGKLDMQYSNFIKNIKNLTASGVHRAVAINNNWWGALSGNIEKLKISPEIFVGNEKKYLRVRVGEKQTDPSISIGVADLYAEMKASEYYFEKLDLLKVILAGDPGFVEGYRLAADIEESILNDKVAEELLSNAIKANPSSAEAYCNLAQFYWKKKNVKLADSNVSVALRKDGKMLAAIILKGKILYGKKSYQKCLGILNKGLKINSTSTELYMLKSDTCLALNLNKEARQTAERGLKYGMVNGFLHRIGQAYYQNGKFKKAIEVLVPLAEKKTSTVSDITLLARSLDEANRPEEALQYWKIAKNMALTQNDSLTELSITRLLEEAK